MDLILYSYWRSSCSYRVRIALNLKGLDYEYRAIHLVKDGGEQHQPEYRALNPIGTVPTLVHGEQHIAESMAILDYLDHHTPQSPLFPKNASERATVLRLCETINSGIQPIQNLSVLQYLTAHFDADAQAKKDWCHHWISRGFDALEKMVAKTAGTYCFGDQPGATDCLLIPQVYNANRFEVDMNQYPTLKRINDHCMTLEAFINADPANQPDRPDNA